MLKAIYIATTAILILALYSVSWGQSQEAPRQDSQSAQQQTEAQQRGTEQSPFIIKILPTSEAQKKSSTSAEQAQDKGADAWNLSDRIAAIASIVAFLQFVALVATVWMMVRNGRRQLRAYVFPERASLVDGTMMQPPVAAHANEPGVALAFRNSGQTPAYKLVSWAKIEVIEPIHEASLVVPPLMMQFPTWLGANSEMPKALWFGRVLTPNEIADIAAARRVIYLFGRIEYIDAFKRKRWTSFRLAYAGPFPPPPGSIFNFCNQGNDAN
jgi:hypothetical protein